MCPAWQLATTHLSQPQIIITPHFISIADARTALRLASGAGKAQLGPHQYYPLGGSAGYAANAVRHFQRTSTRIACSYTMMDAAQHNHPPDDTVCICHQLLRALSPVPAWLMLSQLMLHTPGMQATKGRACPRRPTWWHHRRICKQHPLHAWQRACRCCQRQRPYGWRSPAHPKCDKFTALASDCICGQRRGRRPLSGCKPPRA